MMVNLKTDVLKLLWLILMITFHLGLSYYAFGGWWHSCLGSITIIFFSYLAWPTEFIDRIGLRLKRAQIIYSFILALVLLLGASKLILEIARLNKIIVEPGGFGNLFHNVFYSLNEEMILGAILLNAIRKNYKRIHPVAISILVAGVFALLHYVVYRWFFNEESARGILTITTLATLFAVGVLRNNLILTTGHIGYSWALHFGWIAAMFGSNHLNLKNNLEDFTEAEIFNLYLGSTWILMMVVSLSVLSFFLYLNRVSDKRKGRRFQTETTIK
jgi:hypothetical protein